VRDIPQRPSSDANIRRDHLNLREGLKIVNGMKSGTRSDASDDNMPKLAPDSMYLDAHTSRQKELLMM
jgi:hypothetical protein